MKQKELTYYNKIKSKSLYYALMLASCHIFIYILMILAYILLSLYFFADPVLCGSGYEVGEFTGVNENNEYNENMYYTAQSQEKSQGIQDRLNALDAIYNKDMDN